MGFLAIVAGVILAICALMPWVPEDPVDELLRRRRDMARQHKDAT